MQWLATRYDLAAEREKWEAPMTTSTVHEGEPLIAWLARHTEALRVSEAQFDNPRLEYRRLFSEAWGTFLLVLVAAGGGVVGATAYGGDLTLQMKALAPGMMVMGIIFFMGTISGAHLNPAVTLAFAVRGNFPWLRVPGYIIAQLVGAILASVVLQLMFGGILNGATEPAPAVTGTVAVLTEGILTLGLVSVILGTASGARNVGINGAVAVGAYIGLVSVWGAPVTGASMNPARSFAPMLIGGDLTNYWIYLVGPIVGAMVAVGFEFILKGRATKAGAEAAQGVLDENPTGL
jgi:aquaporin Z